MTDHSALLARLDSIASFSDAPGIKEAAKAIRSLIAERDALREALVLIKHYGLMDGMDPYASGFNVAKRAFQKIAEDALAARSKT